MVFSSAVNLSCSQYRDEVSLSVVRRPRTRRCAAANATIGWDLMRLPTTRHTPLTGDVKTVAVLNVMQIASFQMMNRWYSDMLVQGFPKWLSCVRRWWCRYGSACSCCDLGYSKKTSARQTKSCTQTAPPWHQQRSETSKTRNQEAVKTDLSP